MSNETVTDGIAACPYCDGECRSWWSITHGHHVACSTPGCPYCGPGTETLFAAIAAHNALCADVRRGREAAAEIERLRKALQEIASFDGVSDYKRGWDAAEIARATLAQPATEPGTDAEVDAYLRKEGLDPDVVAARGRLVAGVALLLAQTPGDDAQLAKGVADDNA